MSQPANDDYSQHLSDDEASYHEDASDNGTATNKPKQQQQQLTPTTTTISNIKLPILKKEEKLFLKQQFEANYDIKLEVLETGYGMFQQLLSQLEAHGAEVSTKDAKSQFLEILLPLMVNLAMTMKTNQTLTLSNTNKVKSGHTGAYSTCTPTSSNNFQEREVPAGFANEFLQRDGRKSGLMETTVGFDKKKLECFKCHNTGHFARECPSKGTNDGKKRDSFYQDQGAGKKEQNQNCLLTMDDGVVNWGEHTVEEEETNHALMAISSNTKPNVSTGRVNVHSVRHNVNSVRTNVNTGRSKQPIPTCNSNSFSLVRPQVNREIGALLLRPQQDSSTQEHVGKGKLIVDASGTWTSNKITWMNVENTKVDLLPYEVARLQNW
ncbi:ribonuclease H-like domain-containing protein [Tanacetum coccineum]